MSIVLGFDWGMKYIGVAVGQTLSQTASPLTSLVAIQGVPRWEEVQSLLDQWKPESLVVGIPLNMDDSEQLVTLQARDFARSLAEYSKLTVHTVDERLSTWEAKTKLYETKKRHNLKSPETRKKVNAFAAAILLEDWLQHTFT